MLKNTSKENFITITDQNFEIRVNFIRFFFLEFFFTSAIGMINKHLNFKTWNFGIYLENINSKVNFGSISRRHKLDRETQERK